MAEELTAEDIWRAIQMQNTGLDVSGIERSEINNVKDLERLLGSALFQQNVGATNPQAFEPTVTYETVALPTRPLWDRLSGGSNGTLERLAADAAAMYPNDSASAAREIRRGIVEMSAYRDGPDPDAGSIFTIDERTGRPVEPAKSETGLAREYAQFEADIDRTIDLYTDAANENHKYETALTALPPEARAAAATGATTYEKGTSVESKASKEYTDRGLSTPDDRYVQSDFYEQGADGGRGLAAETDALFRQMTRRRSGVDETPVPQWTDPRTRTWENHDAEGAQRVIQAAIAKSQGAVPNGLSQNVPVPAATLDPSSLDPASAGAELPAFNGPRGATPRGVDLGIEGPSDRVQSAEAARWGANTGLNNGKLSWDRELTDEEAAERANVTQAARATTGANQASRDEFAKWAAAIGADNLSNYDSGEKYNNEDNLLAQRLITKARAEFDQSNSAKMLASANSVGATPLMDQIRAATGGAPLRAPQGPSRLANRSGASEALRKRLAARGGA